MAFEIVGNFGEFFDLSDNPDNVALVNFGGITDRRYVRSLAGDDFVQGTIGIDQVNGNLGNDQIFGGDGDDYLLGGKNNDYLLGESGSDFVAGNNNNDYVFGDDGNDILRGGKEDDYLYGGDGADILVGDFGFDILTGDPFGVSNGDAFVFRTDNDETLGLSSAVANRAVADRITDFSSFQGDKIVLSGVQSFADIILETVDIDGNGILDTAIKLGNGTYPGVVLDRVGLFESDFIFDPQGATAILNSATRGVLLPDGVA